MYGLVRAQSALNVPLLEKFAHETGGQFFHARNPADMVAIYDTIDTLERTEYETPMYARYKEHFMFFLWLALMLLLIYIVLVLAGMGALMSYILGESAQCSSMQDFWSLQLLCPW